MLFVHKKIAQILRIIVENIEGPDSLIFIQKDCKDNIFVEAQVKVKTQARGMQLIGITNDNEL